MAHAFSFPQLARLSSLAILKLPLKKSKIDNILRNLSIIPIDSQIARLSGFFKRKYNVSLPDALIAATSYLTNSILVTRNIKDFEKIKEIKTEFI